jgi:hypothetical protein
MVLHIHNGDVTALMARRVALDGTHMAFRETLVSGPIVENDWIETRARFISSAFGENLLRVRNSMLEQEAAIDAAMREDEVVLWFEHDLFCLVNFLYLLKRLARHPRVSAIWCDTPIGTREDDDMLPLFASRAAVTPRMFKAAENAWRAYASSDPTVINMLINRENSDFPFLRGGFELHAARFPSRKNGLGRPEMRALELIADSPGEFASIFGVYNNDVPRYGFGDGEFYRMLWRLANVAVPVISMKTTEGDAPPKALFAITAAGENVLEGKVDFIDLNGAGFWLGGAHLTSEKVWRWDESRREIV